MHPLIRDLDEVSRSESLGSTALLRRLVAVAAALPSLPRPSSSEESYARMRVYDTDDLEVPVLH